VPGPEGQQRGSTPQPTRTPRGLTNANPPTTKVPKATERVVVLDVELLLRQSEERLRERGTKREAETRLARMAAPLA
jgi:hypothetical protein